jgi:hypothetical protein
MATHHRVIRLERMFRASAPVESRRLDIFESFQFGVDFLLQTVLEFLFEPLSQIDCETKFAILAGVFDVIVDLLCEAIFERLAKLGFDLIFLGIGRVHFRFPSDDV